MITTLRLGRSPTGPSPTAQGILEREVSGRSWQVASGAAAQGRSLVAKAFRRGLSFGGPDHVGRPDRSYFCIKIVSGGGGILPSGAGFTDRSSGTLGSAHLGRRGGTAGCTHEIKQSSNRVGLSVNISLGDDEIGESKAGHGNRPKDQEVFHRERAAHDVFKRGVVFEGRNPTDPLQWRPQFLSVIQEQSAETRAGK